MFKSKPFLIFLILWSFVFAKDTSAANPQSQADIAILIPVIERELTKAKAELDLNKQSSASAIKELKGKLDEIWSDIKTQGYSEKVGIDRDWRGAFVSLQGIIEKSTAVALKESRIKSAEGFIITPRMPTPLMLASGKSFRELNVENPSDFAELRRMILEEYLATGARLNAVYSYNASTALADQQSGLAIYKSTLLAFAENLKDHPVIKSAMADFPADKTGAVYYLNNNSEQVITVQSYQLSQLDKSAKRQNKWAIRFGAEAKTRAEEINTFLEKNDANQLVRR